MYNSFFGFQDKPFNVTPDPRFYYANRSYREAYASLLYGIQERKGFIVLTGEVGVGKTTLLRRLINNLGPDVQFSFLYNTNLSFDELLDAICEDLGLEINNLDRQEKIKALNAFLIQRLEAGETVAALIDEAQNLRADVMEELRVLSNLETANEKLLQIILVGQPELEEKLNRQDLRQLKQRIAIRCRLKPLEASEVGDFIDSRLATAGYEGPELFTPEAVARIAACASGLPRLINNICDNALLIAFASQQHVVTAEMVEEVAGDLGIADSGERRAESEEAFSDQRSAISNQQLAFSSQVEAAEDRPDAGRRTQAYEVPGLESRGEKAKPGEQLGAQIEESEARDRELRERYFGSRAREQDAGPNPGRRIGWVLLAACVLLFVFAGAVYVANPYEIRERLASRGISVDRIEEVIQYLERRVNSVLNSVEFSPSDNEAIATVNARGVTDKRREGGE